MTPVDDLHVGQWVAIVRYLVDTPFGKMQGPGPCSGDPLKIQAISLPFIAVDDRGVTSTIDMRYTQVRLLHKSYVKAMKDSWDSERWSTTKYPPGEIVNETCPHCKEPSTFREVWIGNGNWENKCIVCGCIVE